MLLALLEKKRRKKQSVMWVDDEMVLEIEIDED